MRTVGRWLALWLVLTLACGLLGVIGTVMGASRFDASLAVWLRTLLTLMGLAVLLAVAVIRWREPALAFFLSAAGAAYLFMPLTWSGAALLGRLVTDNATIALFVDLVVWLAAAAATVVLQIRRSPRVDTLESAWPA